MNFYKIPYVFPIPRPPSIKVQLALYDIILSKFKNILLSNFSFFNFITPIKIEGLCPLYYFNNFATFFNAFNSCLRSFNSTSILSFLTIISEGGIKDSFSSLLIADLILLNSFFSSATVYSKSCIFNCSSLI